MNPIIATILTGTLLLGGIALDQKVIRPIKLSNTLYTEAEYAVEKSRVIAKMQDKDVLPSHNDVVKFIDAYNIENKKEKFHFSGLKKGKLVEMAVEAMDIRAKIEKLDPIKKISL